MSPRAARWSALATSTALASAAAWLLWPHVRREAPALEVVRVPAGIVAELHADPRIARERDRIGRFPIPERWARRLYTLQNATEVYDPYTLRWAAPHLDQEFAWAEHPAGAWHRRTNSLGLREDAEVAGQAPEVRVVVAGDSHTDGLCDNAESLANVAEALLAAARPERAVEVLNAGKGGFSFYDYLGTWEKLAFLEPDAFVVVVYGGNDFGDALYRRSLYAGEPSPELDPESRARCQALLAQEPEVIGQAYSAVLNLHRAPGHYEGALRAALDVTLEIARQCREADAALLVLYLPSACEVGDPSGTERCEMARRALKLPEDAVDLLTALGDEYLAGLEAAGVEAIDLREEFRAAPEPLYWERDQHLNVAGHRRAGARLAAWLEGRAGG